MLGTDRIAPRDSLAHFLGISQPIDVDRLVVKGLFRHWLYDAQGKLIEHGETENIVTNVGLQHLLDNGYGGNIYVGLLAASPTVAAGTVLSGVTFTDVPFSESVRPTWTKTRSSQTLSNSASKARFSFTGAGSNGLGGAFLATASGKSETASVLVAGKAFTGGNLGAVANGYTLDIQYDISAA